MAGEIPVNMVSREGLERQKVGLVYDEKMLLHQCPWDPHHIECPDRLRSIWRRCGELGLLERCHMVDSRPATEEELIAMLVAEDRMKEINLAIREIDPERNGYVTN